MGVSDSCTETIPKASSRQNDLLIKTKIIPNHLWNYRHFTQKTVELLKQINEIEVLEAWIFNAAVIILQHQHWINLLNCHFTTILEDSSLQFTNWCGIDGADISKISYTFNRFLLLLMNAIVMSEPSFSERKIIVKNDTN